MPEPKTKPLSDARKKAIAEHLKALPVSKRAAANKVAQSDPKLSEEEKKFWQEQVDMPAK